MGNGASGAARRVGTRSSGVRSRAGELRTQIFVSAPDTVETKHAGSGESPSWLKKQLLRSDPRPHWALP